ncbi:MAG: hypothetical protein HY303_17985, partial [Candidatus Wallbacteria bacterium]|nr:hypothetical protein [Candidatus Wallbacteria bacterium]
ERALAIYTRLGHFRFASMTQCNLAYTRVMLGEGALALEDLVRTLAVARRVRLKWAIANALSTIGLVRLESAQSAEALAAFEEAIPAARDAGDNSMLAMLTCYRAAAHAMRDDVLRSVADLQEARAGLHEGHATFFFVLEGLVEIARGRVALAAGDEAEAKAQFASARQRRDKAQGWWDRSLPAPAPHAGSRFSGVALPLLARALVRNGLLEPA